MGFFAWIEEQFDYWILHTVHICAAPRKDVYVPQISRRAA